MCRGLLCLAGFLIAIVPPTTGGLCAQGPMATQASVAKLEFEVASVKLDKSDVEANGTFPLGPGIVFTPSGGSFSFTNFPLINYIAFAYKMNPRPLAEMQRRLPEWVTSDRFDIQAKTDKKDATKDEVRLMMRALLAERFNLVVHAETHQVPVFVLMLAKPGKTGPELQVHPADSPCLIDPSARPESVKMQIPCGGNFGIPSDGPDQRKMAGRNITIDTLIVGISNWGGLGRPVLDQTGFTGKYDFSIDWTPDPPEGASAVADATGPSFQAALREQLGLKLVATKGPSTTLIIDRVDRPSEN
jgi:uncharacterized protein (TIGR03435 family)